MDPIGTLLSEYAETADDATRLVETQPRARLTSRPHPARWSALECLEHLTLSHRAFIEPLTQAVASAPRLSAPATNYRLDWSARLLLWYLEPPIRLRSRTPVPFQPQRIAEPDHALADFLDAHGRIVVLLESGRGLALDQVRITSPFAARMQYSAWAAFVLVVAHERRHLWQAHRAVAL